jgi:hypothetical protein
MRAKHKWGQTVKSLSSRVSKFVNLHIQYFHLMCLPILMPLFRHFITGSGESGWDHMVGEDRGARWRGWLRHCATSRKVAISIPDGVTGFFHYGPGVDSVSNRNKCQGYLFGGVKAAGA